MSAAQTAFDAAADGVFEAYRRQDYRACLQRALLARDRFPEHRARTTYWVACMRSMTGSPEAALDELEAGLERGDWWMPELLGADPDLDAARDLPRFAAIAARSAAAFEARGRSQQWPTIVHRPDGPPSYLLVALHGGAGTADETTPRWSSSLSLGALLVVPESPFRATSDEAESGRTWPSADGAAEIVEAALSPLEDPVSDLPSVVAGFSQGGRIAAHLAIAGRPRAWRGAILFGPANVDVSSVARRASKPRFWIFVGEEDHACYQPTTRLAAQLETMGVRVRLETAPGIGHDYPPDTPERLDRALAFVLDE